MCRCGEGAVIHTATDPFAHAVFDGLFDPDHIRAAAGALDDT